MPSSNCCFLTCKQVSQEVGRVGSCFWYTVQFLMLRHVFLLLWTIFKVFIEFVTVLFLFSVFLFPFPYGTLAHWPRMEATPPTVEGKGLTTGSPGKSCNFCLLICALRPLAFKGIIVEGISTRIMIGLLLTLILCSYFCLPLFYKPFIVLMEHLIWFHFLLVPYISVIFPFFIF